MSLYETSTRRKAGKKTPTGPKAPYRRSAVAAKTAKKKKPDEKGIAMNHGDLKSHFNDLLNRSDITTALTNALSTKASPVFSVSFGPRCPSVSSTSQSRPDGKPTLPSDS